MNFLKRKLDKKDDIYFLKLEENVTQKVSKFYSSKPFPNYKDDDNRTTLLIKGDKNILASQFKKFTAFNKKILEVGCGTGQLSNYFAIGNNNEIIAIDATFESLKLAKNFSNKNNINNIEYVNVDIFDDTLSEEYFDFIWCNGVLHHTKDPYLAFKITLKSLKKNGYILIGLYNKYGRIRTVIRRLIYKVFGKFFLNYFDPTLRKLKISDNEKDAWIQDQYDHPQESLHTFDEVLNWFKKHNVKYISSIPNCDIEEDLNINLFEEKNIGSYFTRLLNQIIMIFNNLGSDGGLFVIIGKKNEY